MAEFSEKIVSAFYANEARDLIKVRWDDNGTLNVYHLPVDENNADFQALQKEGWDTEKLIDETAEEIKGQSNAFNTRIHEAATVLAREMLGLDELQQQKINLALDVENRQKEILEKERKILDLDKEEKAVSLQSDLYSYVLLKNEDKDELFKCKLWALELDNVSKADKSIKTAIRKSTKVVEVLSVISDL